MVIHAENEQQKKDTAYHIVNGTVCKNCESYDLRNKNCPYVFKHMHEHDYCSKFCRRGNNG